MVGVAALLIALAISTGFSTKIQEKIQLLSAHLNILGRGGSMGPAEIKAVGAALSSSNSVSASSPVVLGNGLLCGPLGGNSRVGKIVGIDPKQHEKVVDYKRFLQGGGYLGTTPDGGHGAIVGADLARDLGVDVGDTIQLFVPRLNLSPFGAIPKQASLKVSGVLKTDYYLYDNEFVIVDLGFAASLFGAPEEVSAVQVRIKNPDKIEAVRVAIQAAIGPDFRVLDLIRSNEEFFKALRIERLLLFLAIGLIVMVAAINIICTLILLVMEKVRDIGILRSMGATSREIMAIFLFQGLAVGVVGTVAGDALGLLLCHILDRYRLIPLSMEVYPLPYVPFLTSPGQVAMVSSFAILVSFLATLYPALKASKLDPVEALRYS